MNRHQQRDYIANLEAEVSHLREMNLALAALLRRSKARSVNHGHLTETVLMAHDNYVQAVRQQHDGIVV